MSAKPLFWRKASDHPQDSGEWVAFGFGGRYSIERDRDGRVLLWWAHDNFIWVECASIAVAKAKAEADWQKRYAEYALQPRTTPGTPRSDVEGVTLLSPERAGVVDVHQSRSDVGDE